MTRKQFKDLDLSNAFLFAAALADKETCRMILEVILGQPVGEVIVHAEHNILINSDFRCVRFDVYASDAMMVGYDLEMQNTNEGNLPKRARHNQAQMDVASLTPGQDVDQLQNGYVIFICTFDPFGEGLYRYTFEERCMENGMPLGDGTRKIFLNTKGKNTGDVPGVLIHFLRYVEESTDLCAGESNDAVIQKLHTKIETLKQSRSLEASYMQLEDLLRVSKREAREEGLAEGREEGLAEGREEAREETLQQMLTLIKRMSADGKTDLLPRLSEDEAFFKKILDEYGL